MSRTLLLGTLLGLLPALASAPALAAGTVTGRGTAEMTRAPDTLRLHLDLRAKGKDMPEALARLKARRDQARARLRDLGAVRDSIRFGEPKVVNQLPGPDGKEPTTVVVSALLRAEWPMPAGSPEDLLTWAHAVTEKVRAADLGGRKEAEQQARAAAEAAGEPAKTCHCGCKSGEPIFLYVAHFTENDWARVRAEAFARAQRNAARLARAAGAELGSLHNLADEPTGPPDGILLPPAGGVGAPVELTPAEGEAFSQFPGKVTARVALAASFAVRPPAAK
ncbi:MAG TPA: SIMPL domain-containing protein [Gemmataceae bacterium]|nr:SIMPL domain-containing protein [Gemmataceae bacterium]